MSGEKKTAKTRFRHTNNSIAKTANSDLRARQRRYSGRLVSEKGHHCGSRGGVDEDKKVGDAWDRDGGKSGGKAWPILAFSAAIVHQMKRFSLPQPIIGA